MSRRRLILPSSESEPEPESESESDSILEKPTFVLRTRSPEPESESGSDYQPSGSGSVSSSPPMDVAPESESEPESEPETQYEPRTRSPEPESEEVVELSDTEGPPARTPAQERRDNIQSLDGTSWLSQDPINYYLDILRDSVTHQNTYNLSTRWDDPQDRLKDVRKAQQYQARKNIDILFAPTNVSLNRDGVENHWVLILVNFKRKTIHYVDSISGDQSLYAQKFSQIRQWITDNLKHPNWNGGKEFIDASANRRLQLRGVCRQICKIRR
jgi:hypothetical protein